MIDEIRTTDYFRNDVLLKRPYIRLEWCLEALQKIRPPGTVSAE